MFEKLMVLLLQGVEQWCWNVSSVHDERITSQRCPKLHLIPAAHRVYLDILVLPGTLSAIFDAVDDHFPIVSIFV